jgi:hypothetical protein
MEFEELDKLTGETGEMKQNGEITNDIIPSPELSPVESHETKRANLMKRLKLKNKILTYQVKFKNELIAYDYKMQQLDSLTNEDLEMFLDEIQIAVRQRNSTQMISNFYFGACTLVEAVSLRMGCDVTGFASVLKQQEEVQKCLDEISLQYEEECFLPATVRLPVLTLQTLMNVYQFKRTDNVIETEMKKPVDKKIQEEYSDL